MGTEAGPSRGTSKGSVSVTRSWLKDIRAALASYASSIARTRLRPRRPCRRLQSTCKGPFRSQSWQSITCRKHKQAAGDDDTFESSDEDEFDPYNAAQRKEGRRQLARMCAILLRVFFEKFKQQVQERGLEPIPDGITSYPDFRRYICQNLLHDQARCELLADYDSMFTNDEVFLAMRMERHCRLSRKYAEQCKDCPDIVTIADLEKSLPGLPYRHLSLDEVYKLYKPLFILQDGYPDQ